jgi:hypothetical protein
MAKLKALRLAAEAKATRPAEGEAVMHKFKIGQRVKYRASDGSYTVTALLPERRGEFKYHIRRSGASIDLVVGESELREAKNR